MTLLRSAGDGLPLHRWLHESIWPREARLKDEDVYWGMLLGATELLCNGVTTTCEQYRHPAPVVDAVLEAGIRTMYTPAIFDVPDADPGNTWEGLLAAACALADALVGKHELLQIGFGRTPPIRCRPKASVPSRPRHERVLRCYRSIFPRPRPNVRSCRSATA